MVSAKQMLTWLDGRNASSFEDISWSAGTLTFGISVGAGANGLQAMVPTTAAEPPGRPHARRGDGALHEPDHQGRLLRLLRRRSRAHTRLSTAACSARSVTAPAHGTVSGTGITCGTGGSDCTETFDYGTVVSLTATPDTGYDFGGWSGACTGIGACSLTMTAARSVGATFTIQRYTLTVTAPTHGTVSGTGITCGTGGADCTETFDYGTVVSLTATPDTGYNFGGWSGACSGIGACSPTMTAARTVGATFTIQRYTLTVTAPTHGTVSGTGITCGTGGSDCTETFDYGTVVSLTATPDTGYDFGGWSGACTGIGACSLTMTAARTVAATFTIQRYTLTVTAPAHGTVSGTGITCGTGGRTAPRPSTTGRSSRSPPLPTPAITLAAGVGPARASGPARPP